MQPTRNRHATDMRRTCDRRATDIYTLESELAGLERTASQDAGHPCVSQSIRKARVSVGRLGESAQDGLKQAAGKWYPRQT